MNYHNTDALDDAAPISYCLGLPQCLEIVYQTQTFVMNDVRMLFYDKRATARLKWCIIGWIDGQGLDRLRYVECQLPNQRGV